MAENPLRDRNGLTEEEFLAAYDASRFERPSVTVDVIIIHDQSVLLIRRGGHPFLGKLALPGGFLEPDEDAYSAAARELFEETGVEAKDLRMLRPATNPGRDPRTRIVTIPFTARLKGDHSLAKAGDDAAEACWFGYSVKKEGDTLLLEFTPENRAGEKSFSFRVKKTFDPSGRIADPIYVMTGESPLAGDHAELIAMALDV